jgi:hypothetical protein
LLEKKNAVILRYAQDDMPSSIFSHLSRLSAQRAAKPPFEPEEFTQVGQH